MSTPSTPTSLLRHRRFVRAIARRLIADDHQRDDVEQETWLAALQRPPRSPERATAWLRSTVHRVSGKWFRGEGRRRAREEALAPPADVPTPDELVERVELEQRVVKAVTALREPYRSTLLLRYHEELSTKEIAVRLGTTDGAVRARLSRGVREVREALDGVCGDREQWTKGLVLAVGLPAGRAAAAATVAGSGAAAGLTKPLLVVACAGVVVTSTWFAIERSGGPAEPGAVGVTAASASVAVAPAPAEGTVAADVVRVAAPPVAPGEEDESAAAPRGVGSVEFDVVDSVTGAPVKQATARFLGDDRFAEVRIGGALRARMTATSYGLSLRAPGYEDVRVDDVEVVADEVLRLGPIAMAEGTGVITGRVEPPAGWSGGVFVVELRGNVTGDLDVRPELLWPAPGELNVFTDEVVEEEIVEEESHEGLDMPTVGFGLSINLPRTSSGLRRRAVSAGETFRFETLPGGTYWMRLTSARTPYGRFERVDLPSGGRREVTLAAAPAFEQVFLVTYADGRPVDVTTSRDDEPWPILSFSFRDAASDRSIAWCDLAGDLVMEEFSEESSFGEFTGVAPPVDRPRLPVDALFPREERPDPGEVALTGRQTTPGAYVLGPLPAGALKVHVTWSDLEARLDLRTPAGPRRAVLGPPEDE